MTGPTRRERLKPLELVAMAGVLAVFTGGIALAATRELDLAAVFAGVAFIAALLVLAMLALAAGDGAASTLDGPVLDRYDGPPAPPVAPPIEPSTPPATQEPVAEAPPEGPRSAQDPDDR
ncbi:hypothetical protein [uncultured Amnibacterium sp.]|uniref:hypothetical protein n=1 Tax=uncultured Amnibacterium sp. TaxID=1631851 RepID=UPI0035C9683F